MACYRIKLCLLYFFFMVVLLFFFYKCTNISCSDEHLFYMALIGALQLPATQALNPSTKGFLHVDLGGIWLELLKKTHTTLQRIGLGDPS